MIDQNSAFDELMTIRRLEPPTEKMTLAGKDPVLPTRFCLGESISALLLAIGVAVNDIWQMQTGRRQDLSLDIVHGAATLKSYEYFSEQSEAGKSEWAERTRRAGISTPHPTKDNRYFLPHMGLPHLGQRVLKVLGCRYELDSVRSAVARWDALELEEAIAAVNGCGAMVRSQAEWLDHPHGSLMAANPVIEILKIGESEPEAFPKGQLRPLAGCRVLDLTRILAGPTCARTLAEHGADVLMVTAEHLPQAMRFVKDTSHGKRSCFLDLTVTDARQRLQELIAGADVFSQGYRPGVMQRLGLSPEQLAEVRPGIIYTSMNCYGYEGPFRNRAGWEQLAQTVTGIADEHGGARPMLLPAAACDYTTGYMAAYGTLLALALRARVGGSYHVRASLCQSGMFLQRQPRVDFSDKESDKKTGIEKTQIARVLSESDSAYGSIGFLGPVLGMSETKPRWDIPSPALGSSEPEWLASNL